MTMSEHAIHFLHNFFGFDNALTFDAIQRNPMWNDFLGQWFQCLSSRNMPILLPRYNKSDGQPKWYAIAFTPTQFRMLKEDLTGFVGPTYAHFENAKVRLDTNDPIEAAIMEYCGREVLTFDVVRGKDDEESKKFRRKVTDALENMRQSWEARPDRVVRDNRSTAHILRDFEMALAAGNEGGGRGSLAELRCQGRLSAENLQFLSVRLLGAVGKWEEMLALESLEELLVMRRPLLVTQELLRAVYVMEFQTFEDRFDPVGAVAHFRESVQARYGELFRVWGNMRAPEACKAFMIKMVAAPEAAIWAETRVAMLQAYPVDAPDRAYLEAVADLAAKKVLTPPQSGASKYDLARQVYDAGAPEAALLLLLQCEPEVQVLRELLACAIEVDTLEAKRDVLDFLGRVPNEVRESVVGIKRYRDIWERLGQGVTTASDVAGDWLAWLERLDRDGPWATTREEAERGSMEWDTSVFGRDQTRVATLAARLSDDRSQEAADALQDTLPLLIRAFLPNDQAIRTCRLLYPVLLYLLAVGDRLGEDDLAVAYDLLKAMLSLGVSDTEYRDTGIMADELWQRASSSRYLDWGLDVLDLLTVSPCPDDTVRVGFLGRVLARLEVSKHRVEARQWDLAEVLCHDLGHAEALVGLRPHTPDKSDDRPREVTLPGRGVVALYTLDDALGTRFRQVVTRSFPGAIVELCYDRIWTPRLEHLAREADIFLLTWRCAKHAATEHLKGTRKGKPLLYPRGKGCASMLQALYDYLAETGKGD